MDESPKASGFVSLQSVKHGPPDAASALADIRRLYFQTTKRTIEHDLAHAIELLKSLATEEERAKASVFMEGMAQMRREWGVEQRRAGKGRSGRGESAKSTTQTAATRAHGETGTRGRSGRKK